LLGLGCGALGFDAGLPIAAGAEKEQGGEARMAGFKRGLPCNCGVVFGMYPGFDDLFRAESLRKP